MGNDKRVVVDEFVVENTWECLACRTSNRGRDLTCKQCNAPRNDESEAVPDPAKAAHVTDPGLLAQANLGANQFCQACRSQVRRGTPECPQCGSTRFADTLPEDSGFGFIPEEHRQRETPRTVRARGGNSPGGGGGGGKPPFVDVLRRYTAQILVAGAIVFATVAGIWMFHPKKVEASVSGGGWTRKVSLYERAVKHGSDWGAPAQASAFNVSTTAKLAGYEQCRPHSCNPHAVGYDCNPYNCDPYKESYSCNPHQCNPHSEKRRTGSHRCNPHAVRRACGTERVNCSTDCSSKKNGYSNCRTSCSERTKYCSETEYDSCADYETYTAYETCNDTCYQTKFRTCYQRCTRTEYDTCYDRCEVIRPWAEYDYYVWPLSKALTETGLVGTRPYWPPLDATSPEQRADREETYVVKFSDGEKEWDLPLRSAEEFEQYTLGGRWLLEVNVAGPVVLGKR